jgi:hypothetical protein
MDLRAMAQKQIGRIPRQTSPRYTAFCTIIMDLSESQAEIGGEFCDNINRPV